MLTKVSEPTKAILIARHSGEMFRDMGNEKLLTAAKKILADLNVLTGINLPENEPLSQLLIFLAESLKQDYEFMTVPLIIQAFKKHSGVLTTGKEKSYGRLLSLVDIHQIMDAYSMQIVQSNEEINKLLNEETEQTILSEQDKENIIRETIMHQLNESDFKCTYADFNQLMKDGFLTEKSLVKQAWPALQSLKKKYNELLNSVTGFKNDDPQSLKFLQSEKKYRDKIMLILEIENEIKGEVAGLFLKYCKENNNEIYLNESFTRKD